MILSFIANGQTQTIKNVESIASYHGQIRLTTKEGDSFDLPQSATVWVSNDPKPELDTE